MVANDDPPPSSPAPREDIIDYVVEMTGQLAALCVTAGRPRAARMLIEASIVLRRDQPPNAAEGDAA